MELARAELIDDGRGVCVSWPDGRSAKFHAIWLRDNTVDAATRSPGNGQRLITVLDLPADPVLASAGVTEAGDLRVTFQPENKIAVYPSLWLAACRPAEPPTAPGWTGPDCETWDASLQNNIPVGRFAEVAGNRAALGRWLYSVRRYGFAVMTGVPVQSGALCMIAELFGYIRETNYGRWFEVRAAVNPNNLAYTNLGLQAHTDNPYRDPVPTLQILACLENSVEGGESMVVDGFAAAQRLRAIDADAFDLLAGYPMRFEYAGAAGVRLRAKRPFIELGPDGELLAVRFNNRSAAPILDVPYEVMGRYYSAYRRFAELIEDPALQVSFRLSPGELFIVDNTRVLHARTAFSSGGSRWLQGCYADKDGLLSTLAAIESQPRQEAAE